MQQVVFTAQRPCRFAGRYFGTGAEIIAYSASDEPMADQPAGNGGPWGWGGFTAQDVRALADRVEDAAGNVIWRRR